MYPLNCKIDLSGFKPSLEINRTISLLMQLLQAKAPSDSFLSLRIVHGENNVNGFLRIVSQSGSFESNQCGIDLSKVCNLLNDDLLGKLKAWSMARVL